MRQRNNILLFFLSVLLLLICKLDAHATDYAIELPYTAVTSTGTDTTPLYEPDYTSNICLNPEEILLLSSAYPIKYLYIIWDSPVVSPWNLTTQYSVSQHGQSGFLHELTTLDTPVNELAITTTTSMNISYIKLFSEGNLPGYVQNWNPPCDKADILIVSSHADDEVLFMGGVIPNSIENFNAAIQVIYITQFWESEPEREHEKLDGLWTMGIKYYPECEGYGDYYISKNLAEPSPLYDVNVMKHYLVFQIRRFKPMIVVAHDFKGEYVHGLHLLAAKYTAEAVEAAADPSQYPDSASLFGCWNTPKEYHHLYESNPIKINLHIPLASYGGIDGMEVVRQGYDKHESQHKYKRFFVADDFPWNCAEYGLYRSTVGTDYTNDIFCNILPYNMQLPAILNIEDITP